jgi:hypothetical protein
VKVKWGGAKVLQQTPANVGQLFDGEPLLVYAWLEKAPEAVHLAAKSGGKTVSWRVELDPEKAAEGSLLGTLAARAAIRDLEEGTAEGRRGSSQRGRAEKRVKEDIVRLAVRYGLASSETSFVAVEEREGDEERPTAELRRIPVALAHGWGGVEAGSMVHCLADVSIGWRHALWSPLGARAPIVGDSVDFEDVAYAEPVDCALPFGERAESSRGPSFQLRQMEDVEPIHVRLALLQHADGSWDLDEGLAGVFGVKLVDLEQIAGTRGTQSSFGRLIGTLAALRFLRIHAAEHEDEWGLLRDKALAWVGTFVASLSPPIEISDIEASLIALLGGPSDRVGSPKHAK